MSKETHFDGWWEGTIEVSCDYCNRRHLRFDFATEEECKDTERIKRAKQREGWITTKVDGQWFEFCGYDCRDNFIRERA